jgi:anti-sigma factor RsiW
MSRHYSDDANCARARSWISHEVDGELSQLERVFLAAHLRRCSDCAHFAAEVRAFTQLVRSAPLERLGRELELPARRPPRARVVGRVAIATALIAVAAGLGVLAGSDRGGPARQATAPVGDVAFVVQESVERERPRPVAVEQPRERVSPPGRLGGNV